MGYNSGGVQGHCRVTTSISHTFKNAISNFDSPSELLLYWWIEALKIDLGAQQHAFSWGTLFTLILGVPWALTF